MAKTVTADDIVALVACLTPKERVRLLRLITAPPSADAAAVYRVAPPAPDEFSSDEESLAWEGDGWENLG